MTAEIIPLVPGPDDCPKLDPFDQFWAAYLPPTFQRRCCACKQIFTAHDIGQVQCDRCDELQMVMP